MMIRMKKEECKGKRRLPVASARFGLYITPRYVTREAYSVSFSEKALFQNLINLRDIGTAIDLIRTEGMGRLARKIFSPESSRVRARWSHVDAPARSWLDVPAVVSRRNRIISGDGRTPPQRYVAEKYFRDGTPRKALSLGCGNGNKDLVWMQCGAFERLDACDISEERIRHANSSAAELGLSDRAHFHTADARFFRPGSSYDVVILDESLHHLSPVLDTLVHVKNMLRPGGMLILNDYVGPPRFQWTDAQMAAANAAIGSLPERYRRTPSGEPKEDIYRPGRLTMYLHDPSEAAESHRILPGVRKLFTIMEFSEYGGTILHPLLKDISHNFLPGDPETAGLLKKLFAAEDDQLVNGTLPSDFVFLVASKPAGGTEYHSYAHHAEERR